MKAFAFRLDQALRWRETQVNLQKARLAAAAGKLAEIEAALKSSQRELLEAAVRITGDATGVGLASYAEFRRRSRERIRALEAETLAARSKTTEETNRLIEANRSLRALENLRREAQGKWRKEFDRELATFADEAFLQKSRATGRFGP